MKKIRPQRDLMAQFRALAAPYRYRVVADVEGFPVIPGRLGQIEYHDGRRLAVYTARPRVFGPLMKVPGVRRHQMGDREIRLLFDPERLQAVAEVIRARHRRSPVAPKHLSEHAYRSTSRDFPES